jgi:hypothetical protein
LRRTTIDLFASPFKFLANLSPEDCVPHNHVGHGIYFVDLIKGGRLSRNKYKHHVLDSRQKMWLEWVRYSPVLSARGHSTALILSNEFGDCNRNLKLIVSQWRTVRAGYKNNIVRKWFLFLFFLTDFDLIFFLIWLYFRNNPGFCGWCDSTLRGGGTTIRFDCHECWRSGEKNNAGLTINTHIKFDTTYIITIIIIYSPSYLNIVNI